MALLLVNQLHFERAEAKDTYGDVLRLLREQSGVKFVPTLPAHFVVPSSGCAVLIADKGDFQVPVRMEQTMVAMGHFRHKICLLVGEATDLDLSWDAVSMIPPSFQMLVVNSQMEAFRALMKIAQDVTSKSLQTAQQWLEHSITENEAGLEDLIKRELIKVLPIHRSDALALIDICGTLENISLLDENLICSATPLSREDAIKVVNFLNFDQIKV